MPTADLVTSKIMTRINPDGRTYRLPLMDNGTLRIDGSKTSLAAFGDAIDKLGMYEASGFSVKELAELKEKRKAGLFRWLKHLKKRCLIIYHTKKEAYGGQFKA